MLMRCALLGVLAGFPLVAGAAPDCREVVAQTVQELKAGYPTWNQDMEQLARMAAGAACVKASGGAAMGGSGLQEEVVASAGATASSDGDETESKDEDDEENWTPFSGIKFNKVSASPNKKPYERRRDVNDIND